MSLPVLRRCSRRGSRLRLAVKGAAALLALLVSMGFILGVPSSAATGPGNPGSSAAPSTSAKEVVQITSISPWVDSDGEFQMRFTTNAEVPADALLTYTIHQPLRPSSSKSLRENVAAIVDGARPGNVLQATVSVPLAELLTGEGSSLLSIPVRSRSSSDRTRAFLPSEGIHPLSITITTADGAELWTTVVFLNHLPRSSSSGASDAANSSPLNVSMVVPVRSHPALSGDTASISTEDRNDLDSLTKLLANAPKSPLKIVLRGDTIAALENTDTKWARDTLTTIEASLSEDQTGTGSSSVPSSGSSPPNGSVPTTTEAMANSAHSDGPVLVATSFVDVDTEGIARLGGQDVLREQLDLGTRLAQGISKRPVLQGAWVLDEHVGPAAVSALESLGVSTVLVGRNQLNIDDKSPGAPNRLQAQRLSGSRNIRVITVDDQLSSRLVEDARSPVARAHEILSSLIGDWFDNSARRDPLSGLSEVLLVQPNADPSAVAAIGAALGGSGPLRSTGPGALVAAEKSSESAGAQNARAVTLKTPQVTDGLDKVIEGRNRTASQLAAFASMAPEEPLLDRWGLANAETLSVSLPQSDVSAVHNEITDQITKRVAQITPPPTRRIVLTSRRTTIPLRFRNGLSYPVTFDLHVRSSRLEVLGGNPVKVVLAPGENRVNLEIVVRAPGESLMRVRLSTPDGDLELSNFDIPVQSTAISGAGAALSVISVLFLLVWWARTFRRERRRNARTSNSHPSGPSSSP